MQEHKWVNHPSLSWSPLSPKRFLLFKLRSILQPDLTGPPENNKLPKKKLLILYIKYITNTILKPETIVGDQAEKQRVIVQIPVWAKLGRGQCQDTPQSNAHVTWSYIPNPKICPRMSFRHRGAPCPCPYVAGTASSTLPVTPNRDPGSQSEI